MNNRTGRIRFILSLLFISLPFLIPAQSHAQRWFRFGPVTKGEGPIINGGGSSLTKLGTLGLAGFAAYKAACMGAGPVFKGAIDPNFPFSAALAKCEDWKGKVNEIIGGKALPAELSKHLRKDKVAKPDGYEKKEWTQENCKEVADPQTNGSSFSCLAKAQRQILTYKVISHDIKSIIENNLAIIAANKVGYELKVCKEQYDAIETCLHNIEIQLEIDSLPTEEPKAK